ncbi:protein-glutamate methylesterase/protein-glutamine glutaminase [Cohaesibacter celericrescens]|uniref:Protein-glutamate methylesterase/protein-glutamine glutaminase n=1 Tax=Cohaesibacter celericrescens TaxID=2067669 RepID=A0A2N5XM36_9HYPH|nr:chemotaxis response regulator protein-glutamate methylesterase [Cohaesibacter celericrescens]PLW75601.1 chemotaxis response regulator protein-glutamate methylesterase [Cohaesibacter celericrescens]
MGLMSANATVSRATSNPIKVMVVDDSVVIRGLIGRWVSEDPALVLAGSHRNGRLAVEDVAKSRPDIVVLDIEMPDMDGLTALPLLLKGYPSTRVIMASTLTRRNAEISMRALSLGATDYVPKPESNSQITTSKDFRTELINKIKALGGMRDVAALHFRASRPTTPRATATHSSARAPQSRTAFTTDDTSRPRGATNVTPVAATQVKAISAAGGGITLRKLSSARPRALLIGSSTGGPQALEKLLQEIGPQMRSTPILITQHMPATFTAILADHLARASGMPAAEAQHGEIVQNGHIYVAPGGKHMELVKQAGQAAIKLTDDAPVNFCKPAVDPFFESAANVYGAAALGVILTGMGHDGTDGAQYIVDAGGSIIAQDEATSVVWGMPGAAANAGVCSAVLPLNQIGSKVMRIFRGERA